jgi:hypothetical protein
MTPADLKDPRAIGLVVGLLLGGGGFGGGALYANDKASRDEVETIVERHPVIVELTIDVKNLKRTVDENQLANDKKLDAILETVKEIKENGR